MDVPLHQCAAVVGDVLEGDVLRQHVHRRDELLASVRLGLVDEALGGVGVEPHVVLDPVPLHVVLDAFAGLGVSDRVEPGGLGDRRVGPLRQANDVDGDEVLGKRLLFGCHPIDARQVDRPGGVVGGGCRIVLTGCIVGVGDRRPWSVAVRMDGGGTPWFSLASAWWWSWPASLL